MKKIIVRILNFAAITSGLAAFVIGLGVAGRDEMLSEIGQAASFNPLPGLALAFALLAVAIAAKVTAVALADPEEDQR